MTVQELNTLMWCDLCGRPHGLRDAKHRQRVALYEFQETIWSPGYESPVRYRPMACGDCERYPCRCEPPADLDLAWLPHLADHDLVPQQRKRLRHAQ